MSQRCFHGGRFHESWMSLCELPRLREVVPADVLDAWFPPAPAVLGVLSTELPLLCRTAPPTHAEPLEAAIADDLRVEPEAILSGAGSSALIHLALNKWLWPGSSVWVSDPGYAEYRHLAKRIGCQLFQSPMWSAEDLSALRQAIESCVDLIVLINPNNPTGWRCSSECLESLLSERRPNTRIWVDEAYACYSPEVGSLARFAAKQRGVFVSRTLSKSHALSGLRVAFLVGHPDELDELRDATPPWSVSFPAQVAAMAALQDSSYYRERYAETGLLREELAEGLVDVKLEIVTSAANWVLAQHAQAPAIIQKAQQAGVYLRDPSNMRCGAWPNGIRIAVRSRGENQRVIDAVQNALG